MTLSHCPHYVKLPTQVLRYQVLYTVSVILFTLSKARLYNVYIITFKSGFEMKQTIGSLLKV